MNQEVVISPTFFESLGLCMEKDGQLANTVVARLHSETLVVDEGGITRQEWNRSLECSPEAIKTFYPEMIGYLISFKRLKELPIRLRLREEARLPLLENEIELANRDECRVVLAIGIDENVRLKTQLCAIEVADIAAYLSPPVGSRIKADESFHKLPNEFFDEGLLKKYLGDEQKIEIQDPYAWRPANLRHIDRLLSIYCRRDVVVEIITKELRNPKNSLPEERAKCERTMTDARKRIEALKKRYSNRLHCCFEQNQDSVMERSIETDHYRIECGHFFGSVDDKGLVLKEFTMSIKRKQK